MPEAAKGSASSNIRSSLTLCHQSLARRLVAIPAKRRARVVVLLELLRLFEPRRDYPEKQVNEILGVVHDDFAYLRRELIDYGFMVRDAGIYRVAEEFPEPGNTVAQEIPERSEGWFRDATRP